MAGNSTKVLLIRFSALGDVFLAKDAMTLLNSSGFHGEIHFLTKEAYRHAVVLNAPGNLRVHCIPNRTGLWHLIKLVSELRKQEFSLVIDLHSNLRSRITSFIIGRQTLRISKRRLREYFLYGARSWGRAILGKHYYWRVQEGRRLLTPSRMADCYVQNDVVQVSKKITTTTTLPHSLVANSYICISAESAWQTKRWPKDQFYKLANRLKKHGHEIVWIGLENNEPVPQDCATLDLRGQLSLEETSEVLRGAALLICNDTGVLHLSETMGTPVVAIYGPTSPEFGFGPRLKTSHVVEINLWCRPCSKTGLMCHRSAQPQKCLTDISVDQVFNKVIATLEELQPFRNKINKGAP